MNNFTQSFTYLKHRDRYLQAAKIRRIKQKLAAYNLTFFIAKRDLEEPYSIYAKSSPP